MFGHNEWVTLTVLNAVNKENQVTDLIISLPLEDDINLDIPDDIIQVSLFEYHDGRTPYGNEAFKICVGKETSIRKICKNKEVEISEFTPYAFDAIESADDRLCYFVNDEGKHIVFAKLDEDDILVSDTMELKFILYFISDKFRQIEYSLIDIKSIDLIRRKKMDIL